MPLLKNSNLKRNKKIKTCFHVCLEGKQMKLLVFTLHFWLKGLRGINNNIK